MSPRIAAAASIAIALLGALSGCGSAAARGPDLLRVRAMRVKGTNDFYVETRWVDTKVEEERVVQAPCLIVKPREWSTVFVGEDPTREVAREKDPRTGAPAFGKASGFLTMLRCGNLDALIELEVRAYLLEDGVPIIAARKELLLEDDEEQELRLACPPG